MSTTQHSCRAPWGLVSCGFQAASARAKIEGRGVCRVQVGSSTCPFPIGLVCALSPMSQLPSPQRSALIQAPGTDLPWHPPIASTILHLHLPFWPCLEFHCVLISTQRVHGQAKLIYDASFKKPPRRHQQGLVLEASDVRQAMWPSQQPQNLTNVALGVRFIPTSRLVNAPSREEVPQPLPSIQIRFAGPGGCGLQQPSRSPPNTAPHNVRSLSRNRESA